MFTLPANCYNISAPLNLLSSVVPQCCHVRCKFHSGRKCHSPQYHGLYLSILGLTQPQVTMLNSIIHPSICLQVAFGKDIGALREKGTSSFSSDIAKLLCIIDENVADPTLSVSYQESNFKLTLLCNNLVEIINFVVHDAHKNDLDLFFFF